MTEQEILEYNKRCAKFLGYTIKPKDGWYDYEQAWLPDGKTHYTIDQLKFYSDWNWIMEVVEAIERLGYSTDSYSKISEGFLYEFNIWNNINPEIEGRGKTKKQAAVQAINRFLIWYNAKYKL